MAKTCVSLSECVASFGDGPKTKDGHRTFTVCSPCGQVGGCLSMNRKELTDADTEIGRTLGQRKRPRANRDYRLPVGFSFD